MLYCVLMLHFCTYTEYLFAHDQSRMRKMQSGERIMRISLSALVGTVSRYRDHFTEILLLVNTYNGRKS